MTADKSQFKFLDEQGGAHWWYRAKNDLVEMCLDKFLAGAVGKKILDVGCGAGNLSRNLADKGYEMSSVDFSEDAIKYCKGRGLADARVGDAANLPFHNNIFDGAVASEILEHIEDDSRALKEIYRVLKPGGVLVITVPALPLLFGHQDIYWGHFRRYTKNSLCNLIDNTKFQIIRLTYSNLSLFVPAFVFRIFSNFFYKRQMADTCDECRFNNVLISSFFARILKVERAYLRRFNFPVGVSLLAVLKKAE